jgi:hypothetical protein
MSWNIQKPGDYINGPLTVVGAVTLNSTFTVSGVSRFFSTGDGLFVSGSAGPDLYTIGVNYYNNSGTESVQVSPRPSWKIEHKNSSNALAYFDIGFRVANAAAGTFTSRFKIDGTGNAGFSVEPFANARVAVSGATSVNTSNYIGASTWAARFIGNSNGAASGISLLSYSAAGFETPASLHVVPIADYRSALVATFSADASGAGYFAVNQFNPAGSSTLERFRVNRNGAVVLGGGTVDASGIGIAFPAAQSASTDANTLDDYEEGTWTPIIVGTAPVGTGTYTFQGGRYTKIGNRVFVEGYISWSAHTGGGTMSISGLPFNVNSSVFYSSGCIGDVNAIALTAGNTLTIAATSNSAEISMRQLPVGGGTSSAVPLDTQANISFSLCYLV